MSVVDEVVARLGALPPHEVWVVTTEYDYEAGELIGVARTLERAQELAVEHNGGKPIDWKPLQTNGVTTGPNAGRTYRWHEAVNDYYHLNLEEVQ